MKFAAVLLAVVVLAAVCQAVPLEGDNPYCNCAECKCVPYGKCQSEAIVPYSWCPGSYIYGCCNMTKLHEIEQQANQIKVIQL